MRCLDGKMKKTAGENITQSPPTAIFVFKICKSLFRDRFFPDSKLLSENDRD